MEGLNVGIAFMAGLLSFLSPCVLPLIPSYLSFIGGSSIKDLQDDRRQRLGTFYNTVFFVLGFSIVFVVLGAFVSVTLGAAARLTQVVNIVGGIIVILLGLNFIFDFWHFLNIEKRMHLSDKPTGFVGSFFVGTAFGAGWAPCVGPILASILLLAATGEGGVNQGLILLVVYSLGLGLPFLAAGLFFSRAEKAMQRIKPHLNTIKVVSGVFLVGIGLLILLGKLQRFNTVLFSASNSIERFEAAYPLAARWLFGLIFLVFAALLGLAYVRRRGDKPRSLRPVRLTFMVAIATLGVLSVVGVVSIPSLLSFWFQYQGI